MEDQALATGYKIGQTLQEAPHMTEQPHFPEVTGSIHLKSTKHNGGKFRSPTNLNKQIIKEFKLSQQVVQLQVCLEEDALPKVSFPE